MRITALPSDPSPLPDDVVMIDGDTSRKTTVVQLVAAGTADGSTTNDKLANMEQATIKGRASGAGAGAPADLTAEQARTIIDPQLGSYTPAAGTARTLRAKGRDIVSVKDFNVAGDGTTDDLAALQTAVAAGVSLVWPAGTYRLSGTLVCANAQEWIPLGRVSFLYDAASGSAAAPAIEFQSRVEATGPFHVNHQENTKGFGVPTGYSGNIIYGSAVIVSGDYSNLDGWIIENAWDNGISVVKFDGSGVAINGSPKYGTISNVRTYRCGAGNRGAGGKLGAGIDIASGSAWVVANCVDYYSYTGFILDTGAGAQAQFVNCTAWYSRFDAATPSNGSGYGFYTGSNDSTFTNCYSFFSEFRGFWVDGDNCDFLNCGVYAPQRDGVLVKKGKNRIDIRVKDAGQLATNTYDAVIIDSSAANISELFINLHTTGSLHRWGVNASGGGTIAAFITGSVTGQTGRVNRQSYAIGTQLVDTADGRRTAYNKEASGFEHDFAGRGRLTPLAANSSYLSSAFGDSGLNGTFFVEDFASPAKRGAFGYDPVNDCFVAQSMHAGIAKKPFFINPSGGAVMIGDGTWNNGPARMGAFHLWVDGSGRLRIKSSAPTSDTDGTVVGTQT